MGPIGPARNETGEVKPNYPGAGKYPSGPRGGRVSEVQKPAQGQEEDRPNTDQWPSEESKKVSLSEGENVLDHKRRTKEEEPYFVDGIVIDSIEYSVVEDNPSGPTKQSVLVRLDDAIQVRADAWKYLHVKVGDRVTLEVMQRHIEDITQRQYIVYTKR